MENEKNNKGKNRVLILLIIIIVVLLTLVILFATGVIKFKSNTTNGSSKNSVTANDKVDINLSIDNVEVEKDAINSNMSVTGTLNLSYDIDIYAGVVLSGFCLGDNGEKYLVHGPGNGHNFFENGQQKLYLSENIPQNVVYPNGTSKPISEIDWDNVKIKYCKIDKMTAVLNGKTNSPQFELNFEKSFNNVDEIEKEDNIVVTFKEETKEYTNSTGITKVINKRNLPIIEYSNKSVSSKIENYLKDISDARWKELNDSSKNAVDYPYDTTIGVNYIFDIGKISNNYLSISFTSSGSLGGIGWTGLWGYNFNLTTGEIIEFDSILKDKSYKNEIFSLVINNVKSGYNNVYDYETLIKEHGIGKTGNWYFKDNKLVITFESPRQIANVEAKIDIKDIENYLKDEYKLK